MGFVSLLGAEGTRWVLGATVLLAVSIFLTPPAAEGFGEDGSDLKG